MAFLKISNTDISGYIKSLTISHEPVWNTKAGRTLTADYVGRVVARKWKLQFTTRPLSQKEVSMIIGLVEASDFFNVSFDYLFEFTNTCNYKKENKNIEIKIVGERLKAFRKSQKLTQVKLASILNTVQPVIANYEKGKNLIATPFLYTICKKYNISADYLLGKIDNPKYLNI